MGPKVRVIEASRDEAMMGAEIWAVPGSMRVMKGREGGSAGASMRAVRG